MSDSEEIIDLRRANQLLHNLIDNREVEIERLTAALEMIAGTRQCIDNLMSDKAIARRALEPQSMTAERPMTVPICETCWRIEEPLRPPVLLTGADPETCYRCKQETRSGIYVRRMIKVSKP